MPVGQIGTIASTSDFTVTRDQLIRYAYETAGLGREGEGISAEELEVGKSRLNMIVREVDQSGNWVWTVQEASHLSLMAGVGVYDVNAGLPGNISELVSVVSRSKDGYDSAPLKILKPDAYEGIANKLETGSPCAVYLTNDTQLNRRRLYVWPFPAAISAQSKVLGTDGAIYKCIYPHTSSATSKPITGQNWRMVWEVSSGASTAWALDTDYAVGESLRMVIKRPLYDFDTASNTPDFPMQFPRLLMLRLALDVGTVYRVPPATLDMLSGMIRGSFTDIFPSTRPKTNTIHNKAEYF